MDASAVATPHTTKPTPTHSGTYSASALTIGVKLKEFVVTGIIGEGGFGIVYSANDTQLQRNVAIKEYMPAAIANRLSSSKINLRSVRHQQTFAAGMQGFIDEARLLAQFKHPALVEILRFWEDNGTAYMVMPHYSGKTLRNILKTSRNVCSERWLKSILGPVLDAIELLHSHHVYHRDIAPDNIVIQDTGQPVLLDLGSARRVIAGMQSALTVVVKPGYAPIEQYTEDTANEQGPWTDIYALGAVLYFAISGTAPTASVSRMMRDTLKPLTTNDYPHYSDSFLSSINKALQLRPSDRFQSIADLREALNLHHSLTGNDAHISPIPESGIDHQDKHNSEQHHDEEITLILSEDEISVFKEKLLQSLSSPGNAGSMHRKFNENILSNEPHTKRELPISSFADVKDLLESNPYSPGDKNSPARKRTPNTAKSVGPSLQERLTEQPQIAEAVKPSPTKLPIVIGASILTSIALVAVYITISNTGVHTKQRTESENAFVATADDAYKSGATNTRTHLQENAGAALRAQQNVLSATTTIFQPEIKSPLFVEPPISKIEQQMQQPVTEELGIVAAHQPDASPEPDANQSSLLNTEVISVTNARIAEKQNSDVNKAQIAVNNSINTEHTTAQAIEMGSAKLTLVPWGEIWVNNQRYGVSPPLREILLAPGTYTIELRNPGLPTDIRTLVFAQGDNPAIHHNFSTAAHEANTTNINSKRRETSKETKAEKTQQDIGDRSGTEDFAKSISESESKQKSPITSERLLHLKVLPWGEIFLNGKMVGVTPPLHDLKLVPGEHTIEIRHPSYAPKTITITADDPATQKIEHMFQ